MLFFSRHLYLFLAVYCVANAVFLAVYCTANALFLAGSCMADVLVCELVTYGAGRAVLCMVGVTWFFALFGRYCRSCRLPAVPVLQSNVLFVCSVVGLFVCG